MQSRMLRLQETSNSIGNADGEYFGNGYGGSFLLAASE